MRRQAKLSNSCPVFAEQTDLAAELLAGTGVGGGVQVSPPWWATPSPGTQSLRPSVSSKPQALTTKSALFFGGLTSDVLDHGAKPPAKRTFPTHFPLVRGSVAGGHKEHTPLAPAPPTPALESLSPLVPALFMAEAQLPKGPAGFLRVLPTDPKQARPTSGESQTAHQKCTSSPVGAATPTPTCQ